MRLMQDRWSNHDVQILRKLWPTNISVKDLCYQLGRSENCIRKRAKLLKLGARPKYCKRKPRTGEYEGKPKAEQRYDVRIPCMRCKQTFLSCDKRSNRICNSCKQTPDWHNSHVEDEYLVSGR